MADLSTTNLTATVSNKVIHAIIFDVAVKAAEVDIIAAAPFMGAPVLKQIDEAVLNFIAQKIYEKLAMGVTFVIIDSQTGIEAAHANEAKTELQTALQGTDQNAIDQATKKFEDAFSKLVHTDGSATA